MRATGSRSGAEARIRSPTTEWRRTKALLLSRSAPTACRGSRPGSRPCRCHGARRRGPAIASSAGVEPELASDRGRELGDVAGVARRAPACARAGRCARTATACSSARDAASTPCSRTCGGRRAGSRPRGSAPPRAARTVPIEHVISKPSPRSANAASRHRDGRLGRLASSPGTSTQNSSPPTR